MDEENKTVENIEQEIRNLQAELTSVASPIGDWKVCKCYEYALSGETAPYDIQELHTRRQAIRNRINELQEELRGNN